MMQVLTGPALDAEVAYRRESVLRSASHRAHRRAARSTTSNERPAARTQTVRPRQAA
jgi:hypothetical protein